ncbi:CobW family GTP-binding protein [Plastorhodobacter daqingensis]|uniref:CobW family GTP-binding protein n=1 Tax=Plastorhodobacter daqingensis TaxID=1387281 RepID=A0ABW2UM81_9RHOB
MKVDGRLKLVVLGGYLGSGKTTWLRHQLHKHDASTHVIVNEAAETPVDHGLLGRAAGLSVLAGGCACCTGRDGFVRALRNLCDGWSRAGARRPDQILLETSGLADPAPIIEAIRSDPVLTHHVLVSGIIVLVDAQHGSTQLRSEPLGRAQVAAADRLILTKTAGVADRTLAQLVADLRAINPGAEIAAAEHGVPRLLPDLPMEGLAPLPPLPAAEDLTPMVAMRVALEGVNWAGFSLWLSAVLHARGNDLVRVKGVMRTPAGRLLVQAVRQQVQAPEVLPDAADDPSEGHLVVLGRGCNEAQLARSLGIFTA